MTKQCWLIKFGIGGVQESIARSRRLRDLREGSHAIVEATRSAAAATSGAGTVLTPAGVEAGAPCGNQLVVELRGDQEYVSRVAISMEKAARKTWLRRAQRAFRAAKHEFNDRTWTFQQHKAALKQVQQSLELWWVAVPIHDSSAAAWENAYERLALLALDRRRTRIFSQLARMPDAATTCPQCGVRPRLKSTPSPQNSDQLAIGEVLCVVCTARRAASFSQSGPESFPSTALVARSPFIVRSEFMSQKQAISGAGLNCAQLRVILSGWSTTSVETEDSDPAQRLVQKVRSSNRVARQDVDRALRAIEKLPLYYAVVTFDGDRIGKWFSGDHAGIDRNDLRNWQQSLSERVGEFAKRVHSEVLFAPAQLVYAGGDDGLVFTSLDDTLDLARRIWNFWDQEMAQLPTGLKPTLSLHASLVHVKEPLQAALARTRRELEIAKDIADRDCLSILINPRAGAASRLIAKWGERDDIEVALGWLRKAASGRIGHTLLERSAAFFDTTPNGDGGMLTGMEQAWHRELDLCASRSGSSVIDGPWPKVRDWLASRAADPPQLSASKELVPPTPWEHFADAVRVLLFMARQLNSIEKAAEA